MQAQDETRFDLEVIVNDEQLKAITWPLDSNVQVIAGPGTGNFFFSLLQFAWISLTKQIQAKHVQSLTERRT